MNGEENETVKVLSSFLRSVADRLEKNQVPAQKLEILTDFFVNYMSEPTTDKVEVDMVKYLAMGWYVYSNIKTCKN